MSNDDISRLTAEAAAADGPAGATTLLQLAQAEMEAYWRVGVGTSGALPHLERALKAATEGYGYLTEEDPLRGQAGVMLGIYHALMSLGHLGPAEHAKEAVRLLEKHRSAPGLPPTAGHLALMMLAQLYCVRTMQVFQQPESAMSVMRGGMPPGAASDLARAQALCEELVARPAVPHQMAEAARTLMSMIDVLRTLLSGVGPGSGGLDLARMMDAMQKLQKLRADQSLNTAAVMGLPAAPSLVDFEWPARIPELDRPTAFVPGIPADAAQDAPTDPPSEAVAAPVAEDTDVLRRDLHALFAPDGALFAGMAALVTAGAAPAWLDDATALAATIASGSGSGLVRSTDHLFLAASLYLRGRRDAEGWDEDENAGAGDFEAAAASLLAAAPGLLDEEPEAVPALLTLARLLPTSALGGLAEQLSGLAAALRAFEADVLLVPCAGEPLVWMVEADTGTDTVAATPRRPHGVVLVGPASEAYQATDALAFAVSAESSVESMTRLAALARRPVRPVTQDPVFIADPRGDRKEGAVAAMLLRRILYPRSGGLGELIENSDGPATADAVRARLESSMVQLDCAISADGRLQLAHGTELPLTGLEVSNGGLIVLPPGPFLPLLDPLLDAGFSGVIGWRHAVSAPIAELLLFLLHVELADNGRRPAAALAALRHRLRDPKPDLPMYLPGPYADRVAEITDRDLHSLVLRGR